MDLHRWPTAARGPACLLGGFTALSLLGAVEEGWRFEGSNAPPRLRRADSFLGIHFDFHAGEDCTEIGRRVTREMIAGILDQVRPDYLQVDCKGHRGLTSYPTRVGNPAPGFVGDPLRLWREVTAERGVSLFMHYSGVWDNEAVRRHPEWARVDEKGQRDLQKASVFGPYVDALLIPQLQELSEVYGVDGVWIDGECWALELDYSEWALRAYREATGRDTAPRNPGEPFWDEWRAFHREGFRRYVRHYVAALHRHNPRFQLTSNWAFSDHMPEPVTIDLDFLSGDYSLQDSVNSARFSARCLAPQGKPWDLMAWAFSGATSEGAFSLKTARQLQREAAVVLAQGGGFQAYFQQLRDGSVRDGQMGLMAEVARFCRARQAVCHRSESVPQVALLYSTAAHYRGGPRLFSPGGPGVTALRGVLQNLLDVQQVVDIRSEHHLRDRMSDYRLIVVPEWSVLEPDFRNALVGYVRGGGSLLAVGPQAAELFRTELDCEWTGELESGRTCYLEHEGAMAGLKTGHRPVKLGPTAQPLGRLYWRDDRRSPFQPAGWTRSLGRGRIAATSLNLGERYLNGRTTVGRDFLRALVQGLFPDPIVQVAGAGTVDVTLQRQAGRLAVNLVNTAGPHEDRHVYVHDQIPPVGPLSVTLRLPKAPRRLWLEPGHEPLKFRQRGGLTECVVNQVDLHRVVVVE